MRLDPTTIIHELDNLRVSFPDLFNDAEDWELTLASETDLDEMLTKLVQAVDDSKALIEGTKGRLEELFARKARFEHRIDAYRALILKLLQAAEVRKRELSLATVAIRDSSPSVTIIDEAALPDSVCKFVRKPDMAALKKALLNNEPIAGAVITPPESTLMIRVK